MRPLADLCDGAAGSTVHLTRSPYFERTGSEAELVVSKRLLIRASGHVSGTITYGEIEIERGGKVSGVIQENGLVPYLGMVRAGE